MDLKTKLGKINNNDLITMFGTSLIYTITSKPDAEEKLNKYCNYEVPVRLGDIIEYQDKRYCVTCVYTDNSVDICGEDASKKNIGLYMKDVKVIGKLQVIKEG